MDLTLGALKYNVQKMSEGARKLSLSARRLSASALECSKRLARSGSAKVVGNSIQGITGGVKWILLDFLGTMLPRKKKKRSRALPLPLPTPWPPTTMESLDAVEKVTEVLVEVSEQLMSSLRDVCKNLRFWKARAEGEDGPKVRFMVFERGPYAFFQAVARLLHGCIWEDSPTQGLVAAALSRISERVTLLSTLQRRLAKLLAEVHKEVDKFGENVTKGQARQAASLTLIYVHKAMSSLEGIYYLPQIDYNSAEEPSRTAYLRLHFKTIPEELLQRTEWTDAEIITCVNLISKNLAELEQCLSFLMLKYRRPRRATRLWIRYTGSAMALALVSGWLIQHSRLMDSNDLENWLKQGAEAVVAFTKEHVEQPLLSIRDDLFETFRRRHHGVAELADVQLTADSLHRMLAAFAEQTTGKTVSDGVSEEKMMEIVMSRYEKELTHPLQNLLGGELFRAMLIQVQKLKLDIEMAMLELNQILRANEINFAILTALPALFLAIVLGWLLKAFLIRVKGAEGRGKSAALHRRMLVAEVEKTIMACQILIDEGQEEEASWHFGMVIYTLDLLYKAVERHAVASGEWSSLRGDILDLARPKLAIYYKLAITARMERVYECLIPLSKS